ncbi:TRAP transporter small permease [Rhizobium sp. SL86]|uniref:TRAP transporter small permease n=1 Tax=Rhizobium sp. SL86 TaxID=2995148 RepID=UPI00227597DB|nr:TRAP transporter small permease [Rhizobium sp. SL86]MCY1664340.1 TRAP transporter small permease [Rhizobium sp. SL86]
MATVPPTALDRFERWTNGLATALVAVGGLCLVGASVLTGLSIMGSLAVRPIPGEIEIVEALCGLAVFAFLPFCQLRRGHVGVDLLISAFGPKAMNWTQLAGDVIITVLIGLLTWRHWVGFMDKLGNGETTPLLLIPVWWGYAIALVLLAANLITCLFVILADLRDIRHGNAIVASVGVH